MVRAPVAMLAALVALALAGGALAGPREVTDGKGRTVTVGKADRVLSLGGSVTEILYALGLEGRIVAVDTTSVYPPTALAEKPNVGYLRSLSAEGVLSVAPDAILAETDAGPADAVALLERASVPFLFVPGEETPEGVVAKIRLVGDLMSASAAAEEMADAVATDFDTVEAAVTALGKTPRAIFVLSIADGRIMAAGDGTSADAILKLAGAENALAGFSGYKAVNAEAVLAAAPDFIVTMAHRQGGPGVAKDTILADPTLSQTPAGEAGRIVAMDGQYLLGFGPRTPHAARDLAAALHPDAEVAALPPRPWVKPSGPAE